MDKELINDFYASLVAFLMMSKQQIVSIGVDHDLTAMQIFTIMHIDPDNPRPMNSLRNVLACDPSNITGIVDGLEHKKLISRIENPKDRRVKMIKLEKAGEDVRDKVISELVDKNEQAFFAILNEEERQQFAKIMSKVTATCPNRVKVA
jgi:DNA-binding MarR family transcriptional regulator